MAGRKQPDRSTRSGKKSARVQVNQASEFGRLLARYRAQCSVINDHLLPDDAVGAEFNEANRTLRKMKMLKLDVVLDRPLEVALATSIFDETGGHVDSDDLRQYDLMVMLLNNILASGGRAERFVPHR